MQHTTPPPPRQQPLLYHDLITPEEVLRIREEVRCFADAEVAPRAWEIDHREESREHFPRELRHDQSRYHVEEVYRDAKIAEIYEGTNEIQKWIIARTIFGKEFTG